MDPLPLFIIHAQALRRRKRVLAPLLAAQGLEPRWIERFDPNDIDESVWVKRIHASLTEQEVSCFLKHEWAVGCIASLERGLILEDDAVPVSDFGARLERICRELPEDFDIVYVGQSRHVAEDPHDDGLFSRTTRGPTTVAYLMSGPCAERVSRALARRPIDAPFDLMLDALSREFGLRNYRLNEPLVEHGSETGRFESSLGVAWRQRTVPAQFRSIVAKRLRMLRTHWARLRAQLR